MAKASAVAKNENRKRLTRLGYEKREALKKARKEAGRSGDVEKAFAIGLELNKMKRDYGNPTRIRKRCRVTGRPNGYFGRFEMSRISLRQLGSAGEIPGLVKSSW